VLKQQAAQPLARHRWIDKEGADAGRFARRVEQWIGALLGAVGAEQGAALAPSAAPAIWPSSR
jgi:hypothetical protein